jgi:hypothetical protein
VTRAPQTNRGAPSASTTRDDAQTTPEKRLGRARRLADVIGCVYALGGDTYVPHAVRRGKLTLRSLQNAHAYLCEEVSGPLDPSGWRRRR